MARHLRTSPSLHASAYMDIIFMSPCCMLVSVCVVAMGVNTVGVTTCACVCNITCMRCGCDVSVVLRMAWDEVNTVSCASLMYACGCVVLVCASDGIVARCARNRVMHDLMVSRQRTYDVTCTYTHIRINTRIHNTSRHDYDDVHMT